MSPQIVEQHEPSVIQRWMEAIALLVLILVGWFLFSLTGIFELSASYEAAAGLSAAFVVGLIAAPSSCVGVVAGLLLSLAATWAEATTDKTRWQRFLPLCLFNIGRLGGYFLLGGAIGALGSIIGLSVFGRGVLTVALAIAMIGLGLNILRLVPKKFCTIPIPRFARRFFARLSQSTGPVAPLLLGALTFFLPCGFTQSMQLLALQSGSFVQGGVIMLMFALGTLPALLGVSLMSSMLEGRFSKLFLRFSGALVLVLGFFNVQNGLALTGIDINQYFAPSAMMSEDPNVTIDAEGRQIISLHVTNTSYTPGNITIEAGKTTWVYATAQSQLAGCATFLTAPAFNLSTPIQVGGNWLGPIENPQRDFLLTCSAGSLKANVHVKQS